MIPKDLQEKAGWIGLKATRPKGRSSMFELRPKDSSKDVSPTVMGDQYGVLNWLAGARWAIIRGDCKCQ